MKLNNFWNDKKTWAPADGAGSVGGEGEPAAVEPTDPPAEPPVAAPAEPAAAPDYSFLPEEVRGEDGLNADAFREHYEAIAAENAQYKDGLSAVPEAYEFAVPEDLDFGELDLPKDFAVNLQVDDEKMAPLFGQLSDLMKKHNMPAEASGEMMGMLAQMKAIEASEYHAAAKAEYERLGPSESARNARIAQAKRSIEAKLPAEQAKALMAAATSYDGVRALETLFRPSGPGSVTPHKAAVDLEKLSPSERLKVINQMQGT